MESVPSSGGSRAAHAGSLSKDNRFVGERRILNLREPSMQNSKDLFIRDERILSICPAIVLSSGPPIGAGVQVVAEHTAKFV